jgi:5'-nucleotidase
MQRKGIPRVVALACSLLAAACIDSPEDVDLDGQDVELVFLHSADIHSRLVPYDLDVGETDKQNGLLPANAPFGGIARLAALVRQERRDNERFAYLETGDVFQGAPIFNAFGGEPEFRAMTQMQVDAYAIGNHEFDNGATAFVQKAEKFANFPLLAGNYLFDDWHRTGNPITGKVGSPYTILKLKGLRVGVIGLGDLGAMRSIFKTGNNLGITPLRTKEVLQQWVDFLRPQVDLVVVVSHTGYHDDLDYIPRIEGVDIVFGGHLHIALNPPNVLQDCDVAKLRREKDQYICNTEEKLRPRRQACIAKNGCDGMAPAAKKACYDACWVEVQKGCQKEMESARYQQRLKELDEDIKFLVDRGCHPRDVLLVHSGAFLKYAGKLSVTVRQCTRLFADKPEVCVDRDTAGNCLARVPRRCVGRSKGRNDWEIIAHKYQLIPIDKRLPDDAAMLALLEPFKMELYRQQMLEQVLGFSSTRLKRFSSGSGDSEVGNLVADAMQVRNQVWADFAVTNSLGIRSDIVTGSIDEEQMTNVFPFENALTVMYLSGYEVQELMDFITQRSTQRGCQSQAQVAGITATLNCGGCPGNGGNTCVRPGAEYNGEPCAQRVTIGGSGQPCAEDKDCQYLADLKGNPTGQFIGEICTGQLHPNPPPGKRYRCWAPIACTRSYRLSTNDYIAKGGSGFKVLERNTTKKNLGISLRAAAKDYIRSMPACSRWVDRYDPLADGPSPRPPRYVLSSAQEELLRAVEEEALHGEPSVATAQFRFLREDLEKRLAALTPKNDRDSVAEKSGITNYLACTSDVCELDYDGRPKDPSKCTGLAAVQISQCTTFSSLAWCAGEEDQARKDECISNSKKRIERCQAIARVRAAMRCMTLPCLNAREDGRLQRIFRDSSGSPAPDEPWPE